MVLLRWLGRASAADGDRARDQGNWQQAAVSYRRYLERRPQDAGIWVQYGHALKESGRFDAASTAYQTALRLVPGDADLHLQIGHLNKRAGQVRAAIASYRQALELQPGLDSARDEIARLQSLPEAEDFRLRLAALDHKCRRLAMQARQMDRRIRELEGARSVADLPADGARKSGGER
jgi:tetratricopeptide (TPR) repeat protein